MCARPGADTSCGFKMRWCEPAGMPGGRGVLKGQLHYFPEQSSQNNTVTREEAKKGTEVTR